jgi:sec-independent protein translocase protein TatA
MLGLDNPTHILFLLVLVLVVFGAKRLPELGRSLGSGMRGFKDAISGESASAELAPSEPPLVAATQDAAVASAPSGDGRTPAT